jgi:hypothetical protein
MLTADQAKAEQAELKSRIDGIVNGTFRGRGLHEEYHFRGGANVPSGPSLRPAF